MLTSAAKRLICCELASKCVFGYKEPKLDKHWKHGLVTKMTDHEVFHIFEAKSVSLRDEHKMIRILKDDEFCTKHLPRVSAYG